MTKLDDVIAVTARALVRLRGETAGLALAEQLIRRYNALTSDEKTTFFHFLLHDMGANRAEVDHAIDSYRSDPSETHLRQLADATESDRLTMFRAVNVAPGGIEAVLDMRAELIERRESAPELRPVELDLLHLLRSWFNRGFLELRQLDWSTPAIVLEKLIEYEAVHEIRGWDDMQRRLAPDRRSFGFFHPALPNEPIIFVEVALTKGLPATIGELIDAPPPDDTPAEADAAIFYSITNCQIGLRGVSFGNFLIKQVTARLAVELPSLKTFATLSPVPGFATWLAETHPDGDPSNDQELLKHRCAAYLLGARSALLPADPVARFHLRNGACLERINLEGDMSPRGIAESHGILVNYVYSGQDLGANHEALVNDGVIVASAEVIASAHDAIDRALVTKSNPATV